MTCEASRLFAISILIPRNTREANRERGYLLYPHLDTSV